MHYLPHTQAQLTILQNSGNLLFRIICSQTFTATTTPQGESMKKDTKVILVGGIGYDSTILFSELATRLHALTGFEPSIVDVSNLCDHHGRARRIRDEMTKSPATRIVLIGHGQGAMSALSLLNDAPRVVGAVLLSPTPTRVEREDQTGVGKYFDGWCSKFGASLEVGYVSPTHDEFSHLSGPLHEDGNTRAIQSMRKISRVDLLEYVLTNPAYKKFQCPVLLLYGTEDGWVSGSGFRHMLSELVVNKVNLTISEVRGGSHFLLFSEDKEFVKNEISDFLDSL
jgi:pimeloyl-ACP methyl ester carboxylesterase